MEDVLWHSATLLLPKSILVKIPRLPTILVIGSQFISTRLPELVASSLYVVVIVAIVAPYSLVGSGLIASREFRTGMPPLRFLVDGVVRHLAQPADCHSVSTYRSARELCARRLIHEGHEFIGETGHRAADANATHVRAAADSGHPSALRHVAVHHWSPAA